MEWRDLENGGAESKKDVFQATSQGKTNSFMFILLICLVEPWI